MRFRCVTILLVLLGGILGGACGPSAPSPSSLSTPRPLRAALPPDPHIIRLTNGYWPPYNGESLPHFGCDSWVVEEAFAQEGYKVEYSFFPWTRSYNSSAAGQWDGTVSWDDTPEHRAQHYLSAKPVSVQRWVYFYRVDQPFEGKKLEDLAGKIVGITTGYFYGDEVSRLRSNKTINFVESNSDESNFRMLLAGRIDVFLMEREVGWAIIRSIFTPDQQAQLMDSTISFSQFRSYLLLSKTVADNAERIAQFDRGLARLRESGRYAEIMKGCGLNVREEENVDETKK